MKPFFSFCIFLPMAALLFAVHPVLAESAPRTVATHRSDGSLFPAVTQRQRVQRPREVSVSGSRQALPVRGSWVNAIEPPTGGDYVAPADERGARTPDPAPLVVVTAPQRQHTPKRDTNQARKNSS